MPSSARFTGNVRRGLSILLEVASLFLALVAVTGIGLVLGHESGFWLKVVGGGVGGAAGALAGYCHQLARQIVTLPAEAALQQGASRCSTSGRFMTT